MKKLDLQNLNELQISPNVMDKFRISIKSKALSDVFFDSEINQFVVTEVQQLESKKVFVDYICKDEDDEVISFESDEDDVEIMSRVKQSIVKYLDSLYSKKGYMGVLLDTVVLQSDGSYHIEPDTIVFVKEEYTNRDLARIVYEPNNTIHLVDSSNESVKITNKDFVDIGLVE